MSHPRAATLALILMLVLGLVSPDAVAAFEVPPGFDDQEFVQSADLTLSGQSDDPRPTAIAWLPDGDALITTQQGGLFRATPSGDAEEVLDLRSTVCLGNEMGLLGVAVDPDFDAGQRFVYLYYTDRQSGGGCGSDNRANRVSRFAVDGSGEIGAEEALIDNILARGGNHNGGDLQFDRQGLLYISVGDSGEDLISGESQDDNRNARLLSLLNGKILRIEPDGGIPAGNPFTGSNSTRCAATGKAPSAKAEVSAEKKSRKEKRKQRRLKKKRRQQRNASVCQEIFATGLRNPYRIAFDPDDGPANQRFYINDVGGSAWEEISAGAAGADYGWNVREGPCPTGVSNLNNCSPSNQFVEPLFAYDRDEGCRTITGGAFVPNDSGWPAEFLDVYLYADFLCDTLFALRDEVPGEIPDAFGTNIGATHLAFGPDNALYYTTFAGDGQVRRIVFQGP